MAALKGWVYFIRGECSGLVKIGWTKDHPSKRLRELQCVSPVRLKPLAAIGARKSTERLLHRMFAELRDHGEWFMDIRPLVDWIEENGHPWPATEVDSPGESEVLREKIERDLRRRGIPMDGPPESMVQRDKRMWWETLGFSCPPPLDRIIRGVNGWLLLKPGETHKDYWAFIHQHEEMARERLRWANIDGDYHEIFTAIVAEAERGRYGDMNPEATGVSETKLAV